MIAHVDNRITYNGNGNATEFAYQFKILDRTDIKVMLTDADGKEKLLTKDYYVDVEKSVVRYPGYAVGAEVPESERPAVLPAGWKLTIYREVPVTQETDLPDQYPFNQVEAIGDKLTMIAQQLTDTTGRSLKIGVSKSTDIDTTIPWENGKSFRISDDGKTLELSEDPAKVLPLAQGVYAQTQAQAQSAAASATAAAKSEDSAFKSAGVAGNSAQYASLSAASASENAELTSGYKQEALTAKADAAASATNAKASETNAKTSEINVNASKEAAQSAANSASNFATDARSSASEAKSYRDAASTYATNAKNYSENVNVFVPSVSTDGVLSWSNKAGLTNPPSVNIKGKDGADGSVTVDEELSSTSTNPVQNKAIYNALLNKAGTDIFSGFALMGATSTIAWRQGSQAIGSINATNYSGTARAATCDGESNVITETYTKKADFDKTISQLGVAFQEKVDRSDLADVATSGKYTDLLNRPDYVVQSVNNVKPDSDGNVSISVEGGGSDITVDTTLSSSSTNAIANKAVYNALLGKAGTDIFSGFSLMGAGATINWRQGSQPIGSISATNYTGTANAATYDDAGNKISTTYVKSVNNTKPDASGNVTITVGGGVSASEANDWSAQQYFYMAKFQLEKYDTSYTSGTTMNPTAVTSIYNATGNLTLDLTNLTSLLSAGESIVFTAYITSAADYALTITNGGTLKYIGSPSDLAITSAGLLLNIFVTLDNSGNKTSIVQASKLS